MSRRNFSATCAKLPLRMVVVLSVAVLMLSLEGSEAMTQKCKTVTGHFIELVPIPPSDCTSPLGLCTSSRAIGGLQGKLVATVTSLTPSPDFVATAVVFLTADLVLHTKDGDLRFKDAAAFNTTPSGNGDFAEINTIVVGGTGKWVEATGRLRTVGLVAEGDADFEGEVCTQ